jgi:hypothetical protein
MSSGLCPHSTANCGWLRPCTLGDFLLLVQEKVTKEKDTRSLRRAHCARSPARLASTGRSPNSPGAHNAPRARSGVSRQLPASLGARLAPTGFSKTPWSSRAPSEADVWARRGERGIASVRIRDRDVAYAHPRRQACREGTRDSGRRPGVPFLLVAFGPHRPWCGPCGRAGRAQFCSRQNCLWASKDKFDGIEFGQTQSARRARARDGPSPKRPRVQGRSHPQLCF